MAHSAPAAPRSPAVIPTIHLLAIAILFLLSGASALVYEVIWTRKLTTFFGSTLFGVATVLSSFMGGLALGSVLLGARSDRMRRPLVVYGVFEILIGVAALLFPIALRLAEPVAAGFYVTGGERAFYLFSLVRFVIVFVLLLVPTTLMGATLPLLSKTVTRDLGRVGGSVGWLYALNTTGAVLGVFAAGFLLLELLGVFRTTLLAVAVNTVVGVLAIVLGRILPEVEVEPRSIPDAPPARAGADGPTLTPAVTRLVLASYAISGFVAMAYQVAWTRGLIFSFDRLKATTYSFSGMLVVFLLGLAIGSWIMQQVVDRQRNLLRLYGLIQAGIGLGGGLSFFMIARDWPSLVEQHADGTLIYWNAVANVMIKTALAIGLPTLLMGMAFPVVTRLIVRSVSVVGGDVARVYAINTVGAILGSFCGGFVLIPLIGITGTIGVLAAANLALAAGLFSLDTGAPARRFLALGAAVLAIAVPLRITLSGTTLQRIQDNERIVHYEEGAMATISVVENNSGDRTIYVDNVGVAGTDKILLTDQKSLAHVPMVLLGGRAGNVLSVGFGSGGASFSYTLYDDVENIYTIEIAPEVLRAAPALTASNHGIILPERLVRDAMAAGARTIAGAARPLTEYIHTPVPGFRSFDPRLTVLVEDARSYLRFTKKKFDVIATDCTDLRYKSNANLYDLQYFRLCHNAITDRGLVVVWMPLAGLNDRAFRIALRTFQEVFPRMGVWYFTNQPTHYCLLIGGKEGVRIDYEAVRRAAALPGVSRDLEEIGLRNPDKLLSSFVADERTLTEFLAGYPMNTEDWPIIEFESPRYGYDSRPLRENMERIFAIQVPVADLVDNLPDEATRTRLWQLQQANEVVFQGHALYREFDFVGACRLYMQAREMVPFDESLRSLLDFEELRRHYDTSLANPNLNTLWIGHGLGSVYLMQGRQADAVTLLEPLLDLVDKLVAVDPQNEEERRRLGFAVTDRIVDAYIQAGRPARAARLAPRMEAFARTPAELARLAEVKALGTTNP
jgi:spermidine synthase